MKFEEILVIATILTGLICFLDIIYFKSKRKISENKFCKKKDPFLVEIARSFFPVLLLVLVLRSFLAEPFRIPSGSMKPTLLEGDFILVNKYDYGLRLPVLGNVIVPTGAPKRGDVIVFRHASKKDLIKRVVGLPGDHILYENKILYINGKEAKIVENKGREFDVDVEHRISIPVDHKREKLNSMTHSIYIQPREPSESKYNDMVVPDDSYFVMGDNRDNSLDSREWGFVKDREIIGRAFATWMSWDGPNTDIRWSRLGRSIN